MCGRFNTRQQCLVTSFTQVFGNVKNITQPVDPIMLAVNGQIDQTVNPKVSIYDR